MIDAFASATGLLLLLAPVSMLLVGLLPASLVPRQPQNLGRGVQGAALTSLALTGLALVTYLLGAQASPTFLAIPWDGNTELIAFAVQVDRVTLAILGLVSLVVTLVSRFSIHYLAGEARQWRFFRWLAITAGLFMIVVIAGNLLVFTLALILTSTALNQLLTYYQNRLVAQMVAHKKLLFSRTAEGLLILAVLLIGAQLQTLSFDGMAQAIAQLDGSLPWELHAAAWLIVLAAILKSGQFPFHGWLLQVMEAPTPVSALLHAGIVYSGAIVVLRTHELLMAEGLALLVLALVGLMTAGIASLAMLTQTAIKSSLAWSTAGQLGFMLLELGLGLFVLALLHLLAHSLYKAHAFLAAGSIVDVLRAPGVPSRGHLGPATWAILVAISTAATFGIGALFGVTIAKEPALLALGVIVGVAAAQPLLKGWSLPGRWALAARTVPLALSVATVYFLLHKLFITGFAADLGAIPSTASPLEYAFLGLVVTVFLALSLIQTVLVHHDERVWVQRLYIHLYNGLYTDLPIERLIYRLWPARFGSRKLSRESRRSP